MPRNPDIEVTEQGAIRTLRIGRLQQSSMYLDAPFDTDFDYPGYLHLTLAVTPQAKRTLIIGLGGGTVVKRMWRDYPEMHIDSVEIDAEVAEIARNQFALPDDERIGVAIGDGRAYLEDSSATYDIVIVDAFDGDGVPRHLTTEEFCRETRGHLSPDGVLAYNFHGSVSGDRSKAFRSLYRTLANVFARIWVFPIGLSVSGPPGEHREIIVLASDAELSADELLERIETRVDGRVSVPGFHRFGDDLYRERVRAGDVPLLLDPPGASRKPR